MVWPPSQWKKAPKYWSFGASLLTLLKISNNTSLRQSNESCKWMNYLIAKSDINSLVTFNSIFLTLSQTRLSLYSTGDERGWQNTNNLLQQFGLLYGGKRIDKFQVFRWSTITLLLLLLFVWPPARAVWPNYEVVMFQPWSGTVPGLGSVASVTSELTPPHICQLQYGYFTVTLRVLTPPCIFYPDTELHRSLCTW